MHGKTRNLHDPVKVATKRDAIYHKTNIRCKSITNMSDPKRRNITKVFNPNIFNLCKLILLKLKQKIVDEQSS